MHATRTTFRHCVCATQLSKILKKALAPDEDIDVADSRGYTAYHHACAGGHLECVKALLKAGCDTLRTNDGGATGWQLAEKGGRSDVTAYLSKYGEKGHKGLALELAWMHAVQAEDAVALSFK